MPVPCQASPDPSKPGLTMLRIALNEIVSANEIPATPYHAPPIQA